MAKAPAVTVWIAQPGARSDAAVEKLTELGVSAIGALRSDLIKGSFTTARMERWARVAEAAAKQSKQSRVPEILGVARFADVISPDAVVLNLEGASGGLVRPDRGAPQRDSPDRPRARVLGRRTGAGAVARGRGRDLRPGGAAHRDRRDRCRRAHAARDGVSGVSTFATEFLGCKVSLADAQAVRERLIADGHTEAESAVDPGREHLLCDGRGGGQIPQGGAPGGAIGGARVRHRLRRQSRRRVRRCRAERHRGRGPVRAHPRRSSPGPIGALGCTGAAPAFARSRAYVRVQDGCSFSCSYCVIPAVRGASRSRAAAAMLREVERRGRPGASRGRADGHQPRLLPRPRRRHAAGRPAGRGRRSRRASSACGCRRSRSTTSPTHCWRRSPTRAWPRTCTSRCSRATTGCCGRCGAATTAPGSSGGCSGRERGSTA